MEGEDTIKDISKEITIKVKVNILLIIKNKTKINNIIILKMKTKFSISNIPKDMEDIMKVLVMFMHKSKNQMIINSKINPQFHR
jgi:hypothetical protein